MGGAPGCGGAKSCLPLSLPPLLRERGGVCFDRPDDLSLSRGGGSGAGEEREELPARGNGSWLVGDASTFMQSVFMTCSTTGKGENCLLDIGWALPALIYFFASSQEDRTGSEERLKQHRSSRSWWDVCLHTCSDLCGGGGYPPLGAVVRVVSLRAPVLDILTAIR